MAEKEYIERETVRTTIKNLCTKYNQAFGGHYGGFGEELAKSIDNMPAADVVEVIRCKDCIYRDFLDSDYGGYCCVINRIEIHLDDYCCFGKRKELDNDT